MCRFAGRIPRGCRWEASAFVTGTAGISIQSCSWVVLLDWGVSGHVVNLATGQQKTVGTSATACCPAYPDGRRFATGDADGSVRIWDTQTWTAVLTLQAHEHGVTSVAVSPDGHRLATVGWDGTLKIWDGTP